MNKVHLITFVFFFSNLIYSEKDEGLELLYQKIETLEQEIKNLRNLLEENSILVDRSLDLQQQRYLDLDARILELSKLKTEYIPISEDDDLVPVQEETDLYKQALTLFEESRYAEALEIFSELIISYPDGSFAPEAYFWSGELFLAQEMFEDAKISYQNVANQFPDHPRSQDSLFKLAEIFRIEGDLESAISLYDRVINEFPDTGASQLSKKSKENLKEESNLVE